ncbi:MAG: carboxypeptidase regulatory-like domain-containing protein [Bacteroidales bacterium]|nr:carboxypeptidase regulatory-like domain-containing protein [Bacteroidales bacterium]
MRKSILSISILLAATLLAVLSSCEKNDDNGNEEENTPPVIQSISSNPATSASNRIPGGSEIGITVVATDNNKDELSYSWASDGGSFIGQTNKASVMWQAPVSDSLAQYEVTATVNDGAETTSESINIYVDKEELNPKGKVSGKVFYANTSIAVNGVLVEVAEKSGTTGAGGYYEITEVPYGSHILEATKEGFDTYSSEIVIGTDTTSHDIGMTSEILTHYIVGTVREQETENPIEGATLVVLNPDGSESGLTAQSSASGNYQLASVPKGEHTIQITHDNYENEETTIFISDTDYKLDVEMYCKPEINNIDHTVLSQISAEVRGEITELNCAQIIQHGHCWSKEPEPTLNNSITELGSMQVPGEFTSELDFLMYDTKYYVRAYATNRYGTFYSEEIEFSTPPLADCGTIDYGGQSYETIVIGDQCWMRENLNIGTMISGDQEMSNDGEIEKYCYGNFEANCETYGGLYQWDEMMQYTAQQGTQGICPPGWHIPTDEEWMMLEGAVDRQYNYPASEWEDTGLRGSDAAYNLKSKSGWEDNGNGSDAFGFEALPAGRRHYGGDFNYVGLKAIFWTSSEYSSDAWYRRLDYAFVEVYRSSSSGSYGFSVRCLQD